MRKKGLISFWISSLCLLLAGAATAGDITLRPNTSMVGEQGLLLNAHIGLNAHQGIPTNIDIGVAKGPYQEAVIAQALLLHQPPYTQVTPKLMAPYLSALGQPTNIVPHGKNAAPLYITFMERLLKIGTTAATELALPRDGKRIKRKTLPSGLYIAHTQAAKDYAKGLHFDTVLGRQYSNGLVLFRTNMYALNELFWDAPPVSITLPSAMRRVHLDGTLGPATTLIELNGFEGAILLTVM